MKFWLEITRKNRRYYATLIQGGTDICTGIYVQPEEVDLPAFVDYKTLKKAIKERTGIRILNCKDMYWSKFGTKEVAYIDATQPRKDCRVKLVDVVHGWRPCWD